VSEGGSSVGHAPGERWEFDADVTRVFDDMLKRSIPQLDVMRVAVRDLVLPIIERFPAHQLVDLGCSRGDALASVADQLPERPTAGTPKFVGIEVSPPMAAAARSRFASRGDVVIVEHDLRLGLPPEVRMPGAFLSVLTLQFVPINYRQRILRECARRLSPGGRLVLVEKVLGSGAELDAEMVALYHASKAAAGYSQDEIDRKALALEGVLVPVTARWNEELLRDAGFREVDCFWRWMSFAGWVGLK